MKSFLNTSLFLILFLFLFLIQTSFIVHFNISNYFFFLIVFLLFLVVFLEDLIKVNGLVIAVISGLFCDFFSLNSMIFYTVIFFITALLIKVFLKKHVYLQR